MNISFNRILGLVALAGMAGACSSEAAVQARFHLPVAAHWGNALLTPGDYKVWMTDEVTGQHHFIIQGAGRTSYEMPITSDSQAISDHSSLELVEVGGNYFVREYRSGSTGKDFTFGVPKQVGAHHTRAIELEN